MIEFVEERKKKIVILVTAEAITFAKSFLFLI